MTPSKMTQGVHVKFLAMSFIFLAAVLAQAETKTGPKFKFRQNIIGRKILFLEEVGPAKTYPVEQIFIVHFKDGKTCEIEYAGRKENVLKFNTDDCERREELPQAVDYEVSLLDGSENAPQAKNARTEEAPRPTRVRTPTREFHLERGIDHLHYAPKGGHFWMEAGVSAGYAKYDLSSSNIKYAEITNSSGTASINVLLGVTDWLAVGALVGNINQTTEEKTTTGTSTTTSTDDKGPVSPTYVLVSTLMEQTPDQPVDVTVHVGYQPANGTNKVSSTSRDNGNNLTSGSHYLVKVDVTHKLPNIEFGGAVQFNPGYSGTYEDATTGVKTDLNTGALTYLTGNFQIPLSENLFVQGQLGLFVQAESSRQYTSGAKSTTDAYGGTSVKGALKYLLNKNFYTSGAIEIVSSGETETGTPSARVKAGQRSSAEISALVGISY